VPEQADDDAADQQRRRGPLEHHSRSEQQHHDQERLGTEAERLQRDCLDDIGLSGAHHVPVFAAE